MTFYPVINETEYLTICTCKHVDGTTLVSFSSATTEFPITFLVKIEINSRRF